MKLHRVVLPLVGILVAGFALVPADSAGAAPTGTPLPLTTVGEVVADGTDGRVFVSGGSASTGVAVTDLRGAIVGDLYSTSGVADLLLRESSSRLYLARSEDGTIGELDTSSLAETRSFITGGCPESLARQGNRLWFSTSCGNNGWLGSVNLTTGSVSHYFPGVTAGLTDLAASDNAANRLVTSTVGTDSDAAVLYDTSGSSPTVMTLAALPQTQQLVISADGQAVIVSHGFATQSFSLDGMSAQGGHGFSSTAGIAVTPAPPEMTVVGMANSVWALDASWSQTRQWGLPSGLTIPRQGVGVTADGTAVFAVTTSPEGVALHVLGDPAVFPTSLQIDLSQHRLQVGERAFLSVGLWFIDDNGVRQGIAGARVTVTRVDARGVRHLGTLKTGANGSFLIEETPKVRGTLEYRLSYAGSATTTQQSVVQKTHVHGMKPGLSLIVGDATFKEPEDVSIHVNAPIQHRRVSVYATPDGRKARLIGRPRLDSAGDAHLIYRPTRMTTFQVITQGDSRYEPEKRSTVRKLAPRLVATVGRATSNHGSHYRVPAGLNPLLKVNIQPRQPSQVRGVVDGEVFRNGHWQYFGGSDQAQFFHGRRAAAVYVGARSAGQRFRFMWFNTTTSTTRHGHSNWVYVTFY